MATFESRELVEALLTEFGGVAVVARTLVEEFRGLPTGHANRIKILMSVVAALLRFGAPEEDERNLEEKKQDLKKLIREMQDEPGADDEDDWD